MNKHYMIVAAIAASVLTLSGCETKVRSTSPSVSPDQAVARFQALQTQSGHQLQIGYGEYLDFLTANEESFDQAAKSCKPHTGVTRDIDTATCSWLRSAAAFELIPLSDDIGAQEERAIEASNTAKETLKQCSDNRLSSSACSAAAPIAALAWARIPVARIAAWRAGRLPLTVDGVIGAYADFADAAPDWANLSGPDLAVAKEMTRTMCVAEDEAKHHFGAEGRDSDIAIAARKALSAAARSQRVELSPAEQVRCHQDPNGPDCLNTLYLKIVATCGPG